MRPNIPAKRVIDRFVEYHKRPFTVKDVANDTGVHTKTVRNLLPQLVREGRIKLLLKEKDGNIYIKVQSHDQACGRKYDWKPKLSKLKALYDNIPGCGTNTEIASRLGWSIETTSRYMRILKVEGCIERMGNSLQYKQVEFKPVIRWFSEYCEKSRETRRQQFIEQFRQRFSDSTDNNSVEGTACDQR